MRRGTELIELLGELQHSGIDRAVLPTQVRQQLSDIGQRLPGEPTFDHPLGYVEIASEQAMPLALAIERVGHFSQIGKAEGLAWHVPIHFPRFGPDFGAGLILMRPLCFAAMSLSFFCAVWAFVRTTLCGGRF